MPLLDTLAVAIKKYNARTGKINIGRDPITERMGISLAAVHEKKVSLPLFRLCRFVDQRVIMHSYPMTDTHPSYENLMKFVAEGWKKAPPAPLLPAMPKANKNNLAAQMMDPARLQQNMQKDLTDLKF